MKEIIFIIKGERKMVQYYQVEVINMSGELSFASTIHAKTKAITDVSQATPMTSK